MKAFLKFFLCLIPIFFTVSCTLTSGLNDCGAGKIDFIGTEFLRDVVYDLSCWTAENESDEVLMNFVVESFADNLKKTGAGQNVQIAKTGELSYAIKFNFDDIEQFVFALAGSNAQDIVKFSQTLSGTRLDFSLSMDNYETLEKMIPILKDPNLEVYCPRYNNPPYGFRSEEDYLYMIDFIFGHGSEEIKNSVISLELTMQSPITATNGQISSENSVIFSFPLIDFLLLHEPIKFFCEF